MVEFTQLEAFVERLINKKLTIKEEEALSYATEARTLVETWIQSKKK